MLLTTRAQHLVASVLASNTELFSTELRKPISVGGQPTVLNPHPFQFQFLIQSLLKEQMAMWCLICKSSEASSMKPNVHRHSSSWEGHPRTLTQSIKISPWKQHCPNHMNDPPQGIPRHLDPIKFKFCYSSTNN